MTIYKSLSFLYKKIVVINMRVILAFLCVVSIIGTSTIACDISEKTFFIDDKTALNAIIIACFALALAFVRKLWLDKGVKLPYSRKALLWAIFFISLAWVVLSRYTPRSDQMIIFSGVDELNRGDYTNFATGEYFMRNPQQLGLVHIYYLWSLIFGFRNEVAYQMINVLALVLFYKKISDVLVHLGLDEELGKWVCLLGIVFYPLIMYSSFIYGTLLGLAFAVAALDYEILFLQSPSKWYFGGISFIFALGACVAKTNYIIFVIAMVIYGIIETINLRKVSAVVLIVLLMTVFPIVSTAPLWITNQITGVSVGDSISPWAFVAMGFQEGPRANGWHNGYDADSFISNGNSEEAQKAESIEYIKDRLKEFADNPGYAWEFFLQKTASQWNNPTFECFWINQVCDHDTAQNDWIRYINSKEGSTKAYGFLDAFLMLIYLGALAAFWLKDDMKVSELTFATIFIGGFLFHLFWEGKTQYTLPYFVLLFPYAIVGFVALADRLAKMPADIKNGHRISIDLKRLIMMICIFVLILVALRNDHGALTRDTQAWNEYLTEVGQ